MNHARIYASSLAVVFASAAFAQDTSADGFLLGADISGTPERLDNGTVFVDTDGRQKSPIDLLGNHGFNAVRLRTFVDALAAYVTDYTADAMQALATAGAMSNSMFSVSRRTIAGRALRVDGARHSMILSRRFPISTSASSSTAASQDSSSDAFAAFDRIARDYGL